MKNNSNKQIFNRKKMLIISFSIILSVIFLFLTLFFVLKIDVKEIFSSIAQTFKEDFQFAAFLSFILFFYLVIKFLLFWIPYAIRLKKENIKLGFIDSFVFVLTSFFLVAVTPANFVSDPYATYFLKRKGVVQNRAVAITLLNAFLWHIVQMIITIPSFFIICTQYQEIINNTEIHVIFWFTIVGILIDFFILFWLLVFCYSLKTHYLLSLFLNKIKKIFKIAYHTKEEIKIKYIDEKKFKKIMNELLFDYKKTLLTILIYTINELYLYFLVFISLKFINIKIEFDVFKIFNITNVVFTANKFILTPGGEMSIEYFMQGFLKDKIISGIDTTNDILIDNSILIWRTFSMYIPAILGLIMMPIIIPKTFKKIKKT
ncbi:MAG: YbhN family protein [Mycoplasmataceae bacterium]|nr:YbhN family protein [Mycoplasmataceae bacterium]